MTTDKTTPPSLEGDLEALARDLADRLLAGGYVFVSGGRIGLLRRRVREIIEADGET